MIGKDVSHYRVVERLGEGAMGEVYLAEDLRLHRPVALKLLRSELLREPEARQRLLREARAASALSHPNLAVIYEVDESGHAPNAAPFIAMEYVAGPTLTELIRDGALDLDAVLRIAREAAEGLADAHGCGIVHRDVKPSNLKLTSGGRVKVLDFGLALHQPLGEATDSTWTRDPARRDGLVGTLAYMAPEQALGRPVDGRADVFSLGVVLYEMLAGRRPFEGRNAAQLLDALLHAEPDALPARHQDGRLPQLDGLLRRMLAKPRDGRPATMRDVADELRALESGAGAPQPAAPARRTLALLGFANITGRGEDDWLGAGISETLAAELRRLPGLRLVAQAGIEDARRRLGLLDVPSDDGQALRLGREAGATLVLLGAFQRLGQQLRVTASLLDVESGAPAHAAKLDGDAERVFELQDRLARELLEHLSGEAAPRGSSPYETQVVGAYEAFSKGVLNARLESHESLSRAILYFERAVALDAGYAQAHLELGAAYSTQAAYLSADELLLRAESAYRRAIALRPDLVRAWRELGAVLLAAGREKEGIETIRHALALDPADAGALAAMGRALFVGFAQFQEAAGWLERSLESNPQAGWYALQLAHCYALAGDVVRGERAARRAVELQEAFLSGQQGVLIVGAHMRLGQLRALARRLDDALECFQAELAFLNKVDHALRGRITIELHTRLGSAYRGLGRPVEAATALEVARAGFEGRIRLGADDPFTRYYAACAYALLGQPEEALHCLALAAQRLRRFVLARARDETDLAALRSDPRFGRLLADSPRS